MNTKRTSFKLISLLTLFWTLFAFAPTAIADEDGKAEIINRCRDEMGQYGASMVKACVDQDFAAVIALAKIDKKYHSILARCLNQMRSYGYSMVEACVDQDIAAEKALSKY